MLVHSRNVVAWLAVLWIASCGSPKHPAPLADTPAFTLDDASASGGNAGDAGDAGKAASGGRKSGGGGSHGSGGGPGGAAGLGGGSVGGTTAGAGGAGGAARDAGSGGATAGSGGAGAGGATSSGGASSGGTGGTASAGCPYKVFTGSATVNSTAELTALAGYTRINGDLYIGSSTTIPETDVATLEPLHCLEAVDGTLTIFNSPSVQDLTGLESLAGATSLKLSGLAGLRSLSGLSSALAVNDLMLVHGCPSLTTLTATGVVRVGSLAINSNAALPECVADAFASRIGVALCSCAANNGTCPDAGP